MNYQIKGWNPSFFHKRRGKPGKGLGSMAGRFVRDQRGSFAAMSALMMPMLFLGGVAMTDIYVAKVRVHTFKDSTKTACFRALKPTRTVILSDEEREKSATALLERTIEGGHYENLKTTVDVNWLDVHIEAEASIKPMTNLVFRENIPVKASFDCSGIPPYPHDGEVLLSTNFTTADGSKISLTRPYYSISNCWGILDHRIIGWDGSLGWDRYGREKVGQIEIQNWDPNRGCFAKMPQPPSAYDSIYGIELDAYYNNEIWKDIELHPGEYELSLWYFGRREDTSTNGISASIQISRDGTLGQKDKVINVAEPGSKGWQKRTFKFKVSKYELYRFYVSAEGTSDSVGGIINDFKLTYLDKLPDTETANYAQ